MAESLRDRRARKLRPDGLRKGRGTWTAPRQSPGEQPIDPLALPPDPLLTASLPPAWAMTQGLLPWRRAGGATIVLCADPGASLVHLDRLEPALGRVRLAPAVPESLALALAKSMGRPLARQAELRVPPRASCRTLPGRALSRWALAAGGLLLTAVLLAPASTLLAFVLLASLVLVLLAALRLVAVTAELRADRSPKGAEVVPARLPVISVLVPLYREAEIAGTLLTRMETLDYPRALLDLCLIVEDNDAVTRRALEGSDLPAWAQIIEVPQGTLRTKPRALNYAMNFARGSIIGIYDAEDIPAPDHLRRVAETFARRDQSTACLQGALDYFNHDSNWIARCFTLEYGSWFRVLLPGIQRLGLALPLGGTTLFLRRKALETVGGWDAHNVTEDADLGLRLARHGFRTEMIAIATQEEANARLWPWVRQRSRWLKGYAITWAVHMRDPVALWRDLGPRAFWGVQVMFLGTLLQFALAPVLWSFWLIPFGVPHPLLTLMPGSVLVSLSILFLAAQVLDIAFAWIGARRSGKARLAIWAPTLIFYFPLATLALYRALWDVARDPFRWEKTAHGIHVPSGPVTPPPAPLPNRAAAGS